MRHYILPRFGTPTAAAFLEFGFGGLTVFVSFFRFDYLVTSSRMIPFFFFFFSSQPLPGTKLYVSPYADGLISLTRYFSVLE